MADWKNWAETVEYKHLEQKFQPETLEELKACVKEAARQKWKLRAVGPGHSWSNLGVPSYGRGAVICMTDMHPYHNFVRDLGNGEAIVEIGGGLSIHDLNEWLDSIGWALFNMGDANPQTVVGAISTETHGSGVRHNSLPDSVGSLSEYVEGITLVRADGESYTLTDEELPAGRVSLGKLGVIYLVRLRVRKRYFLTHDQELVTLSRASEGAAIDALLKDTSVRHFEYWHYPHTDQAEKIVRRRTDSTEIIKPVRFDERLLIKATSSTFAGLGSLNPKRIPEILKNVVTDPVLRENFKVEGRQGPWHQILLGKSNIWRKVVKTYTMEYQLAYENLWPAFEDYLKSIETAKEKGVYAASPTQIRFSQKSQNSYLTHLQHEPTVSFSVSFFRNHRGAHTWLPDLEKSFIKHGGKPHWGKMYYTPPQIDPNDENFKKFEEVRQRLDPTGMFAFSQGPYTPDPEAFQVY